METAIFPINLKVSVVIPDLYIDAETRFSEDVFPSTLLNSGMID